MIHQSEFVEEDLQQAPAGYRVRIVDGPFQT